MVLITILTTIIPIHGEDSHEQQSLLGELQYLLKIVQRRKTKPKEFSKLDISVT